jgi:6-pyruvoyltetrahydropterin/6-carboxytetrahydropterin synthase
MQTRRTRIELAKEAFKFSAGHFTIFSATRRERLHGHNFSVAAAFTCAVGRDGLALDYGRAKRLLQGLCDELDEWFLLPGTSPHLSIREGDAGRVEAVFDGEAIPFPEADVKILPVANITLEELAGYLLGRFREGLADLDPAGLEAVEVRVFSGPGQCASAEWSALA